MLFIPIEKVIDQRDSFRKAREAHLIQKEQTAEPFGIKRCDGYYLVYSIKVYPVIKWIWKPEVQKNAQ